MPIYAIRNKHGFLRLVEARNEAQGIRHCAKGEFSASIPTLAEAIEFGRNGGVVEVAGVELPPTMGFDVDAFVSGLADPSDLATVNAAVGTTLPIEGA